MPGKQTEEEEGVDHSRYLASYREQESPKEESHGNQIREAEREIQAAVPRTPEADGAVKRITRADKRAYMEDLTS